MALTLRLGRAQDGLNERSPPLILAEVVRVELVDQWWQQVLPVLALAVSLFSVGLTLWFRRQEGPRLKVSLSSSFLVLEDTLDSVSVRMRNVSRASSSMITSVSLRMPDGRSFAYVYPPVPGMVGQLPHTLASGEELSVFFITGELIRSLAQHQEQPEQLRWLQAVVSTGHREFKSKRSKALAAEVRRGATALQQSR